MTCYHVTDIPSHACTPPSTDYGSDDSNVTSRQDEGYITSGNIKSLIILLTLVWIILLSSRYRLHIKLMLLIGFSKEQLFSKLKYLKSCSIQPFMLISKPSSCTRGVPVMVAMVRIVKLLAQRVVKGNMPFCGSPL